MKKKNVKIVNKTTTIITLNLVVWPLNAIFRLFFSGEFERSFSDSKAIIVRFSGKLFGKDVVLPFHYTIVIAAYVMRLSIYPI